MLEVLRHTKQRHRNSQRKSLPEEKNGTLEENIKQQIIELEAQRDERITDEESHSEEDFADDES